MDWILALEIATVGLLVLSVAYMKKYKEGVGIIRKIGEAFIETANALEDPEITPEEKERCFQKYRELYFALKEFFRG